MNEFNPTAYLAKWILGIGAGAAVLHFLSKEEESKPEKPTVLRNLATGAPSDSRDLKEVPKGPIPMNLNSGNKVPERLNSISSRSLSASELLKLRTSKNNSTEIIPSKVLESKPDIRKYPPEYYNLSDKAKWKFRKMMNSSML